MNSASLADGEDKLHLSIGFELDAEAGDMERLTQQLRRELVEIDNNEITIPAPLTNTPDGAKGAGLDWGALVMALGSSGGALTLVISTVRDWLARNRLASSVTVTIDGDSITLPRSTQAEREALIRVWIDRHTKG